MLINCYFWIILFAECSEFVCIYPKRVHQFNIVLAEKIFDLSQIKSRYILNIDFWLANIYRTDPLMELKNSFESNLSTTNMIQLFDDYKESKILNQIHIRKQLDRMKNFLRIIVFQQFFENYIQENFAALSSITIDDCHPLSNDRVNFNCLVSFSFFSNNSDNEMEEIINKIQDDCQIIGKNQCFLQSNHNLMLIENVMKIHSKQIDVEFNRKIFFLQLANRLFCLIDLFDCSDLFPSFWNDL